MSNKSRKSAAVAPVAPVAAAEAVAPVRRGPGRPRKNPEAITVTPVEGEAPKTRKPYNLKADTGTSKARAVITRWHKHPHAKTIVLKKVMEITNGNKPLAKSYIKAGCARLGIDLALVLEVAAPAAAAPAEA